MGQQTFYNVVAPGQQIVSFEDPERAISHAETVAAEAMQSDGLADGLIVVQQVTLGPSKVGAAPTRVIHEIKLPG